MESIWRKTCPIPPRTPLPGDREADAVVIGGGLTGILTAHYLTQAGLSVAVAEAGRIAGGQTGHTTAKVTAQHGLRYQKLIRQLGRERAGMYAAANMAALEEYRRLIDAQGIDCDWEEKTSYVYGDRPEPLTAETEAAKALGLPAFFTEETALPFSTAGAVGFTGQAQFHPLKFLRAVAEPLTVYEDTPVLTVDGDRAVTPRGEIRGEHIIFACHYPFVNFPGLYFTRMHQSRSYVLALQNAPDCGGMWIGAAEGSYSFRTWDGLLLLGGGGHRTGENREGGRYAALERAAAAWYPGAAEAGRWSAQDCITPDGVPYIGRYAAGRPNWYVATGFQKWGMTTAMAVALLLRDMICGRENPWAEVFNPRRFGLPTVKGVLVEGVHSAGGLGKTLLHIPSLRASQVIPGGGALVMDRGRKTGVSRRPDGKSDYVNPICPHLGCELTWNPDEESWDCPCHGSRFDREGRLLSGPAQKDLPRR